jgi:putative SOS response-associated peptidase YedK
MCSHYQALKDQERFRKFFGIEPPADSYKTDLWPGYLGAFIKRHRHADAGDEAVPPNEALAGLFGLVPHWAKDTKITRHTYNARSETVAEKPSFRDAWRKGQRCIIPAEAFYEPDWRSGKAVATRIMRADGAPMGIAGLWSWWKAPNGETTFSFTMLTINAADHELMNRFHKPADEKRMVVVLPESAYGAWLDAPVEQQRELLRPCAAELLAAQATELAPLSKMDHAVLGHADPGTGGAVVSSLLP